MSLKVLRGSVLAVILGGGLAAGYAHFNAHGSASAQSAVATPAPAAAVQQASSSVAIATPVDFSPIVERYGPAVVNVSVIGKAQRTPAVAEAPDLGPGDPFSEFFRRFGPGFPQVPDQGQVMKGLGSGFLVSPDGVILTNAHVIDGAQEVTVKLTDRREFKAKVLGVDPKTDVAVIKINASNLPTVKLGNSSAIRVGEPVLAIGSPYGFENTATSGIISAKFRSLPSDTYVPFIQTDVAVNPGNSGGPLFNLKGEVIGINSQIYSRTGGFQGLSFAIPIDVAARIEDQLVHSGKVTRGKLGVSVQEVTQALADALDLKSLRGALVSSVESGSPAEKAGLQPGDIILKLDNHDINQSSDLPELVSAMKPGTSAKLDVLRKGASQSLQVTIGEMKDKAAVAQNGQTDQNQSRLGIAVRPLDQQEQRQAGVHGGLLVQDVAGAAARAGIQQGDVILSINGTMVSDPDQLREIVRKANKGVALLVQRDHSKIFIPVPLG